MTQSVVQTAAAEPLAWLVKFSWGYGSDLAYTDYDSDLVVDSATYAALPTLGFGFGARRAIGDDGDWTVTMPSHLLPASRLARTRYWGPIDIVVQQVSPNGLSNPVTRFRGRYASTDQPNKPTLDIRCKPIKKVMDEAHLGLLADRKDNFWFGAPQTNDIDLASLQETGTVSALGSDSKPNRVTLSFDGSPESPNNNNRWRSGHIEVLGERIQIRKALGSSKYDLIGQPDSSWLNATFTLTPGWDGTIEHWQNYWDGQGVDLARYFTGYGYMMPDRESQRQAR